ncbi:FAD-binding oxidoreductase [Saccharopolyspora taberi]|uniref:FAD-binding oxidoreductase n=1 Tax=Saccharopolyspora taberi TaxID=60895 RepID=A0ABN3VBR6_9PSEU
MTSDGVAELRSKVRGEVLLAGDDGYDDQRSGWNLTIEHRPAVIVVAESADDVAHAVRYAAAEGLPVGVQSTGHGVSVPAEGALLINTRKLTELSVDPVARTAKLGAGLRWADVLPATAEHGLAPLCGSSDQVGVMGYLTGGGLPVTGRTFGFSASHVRELELITADGVQRTLSPTSNPDLFWAVRGGKSNFGVVVSATIDLVPQARLYGGAFRYPGDKCEAVLRTYAEWAREQPEEMTSSIILLRFPEMDRVPDHLRGRFLLNVRIVFTGSEEEGRRLVEPFRALEPENDSVEERPYTRIAEIYEEPHRATPAHIRTALLDDVDDETVDALLEIAGPGVELPFGGLELRQLGGALARPADRPSAVGSRGEGYHLFLSNPAWPEDAEIRHQAQQKILDGLSRWDSGKLLPGFMFNYAATPEDVRRAYDAEDFARLSALKAEHDPGNLFRINHNIPPQHG